MKLFKLFRSADEVAEVEGEKTFLEVDGEKVSVENAVKMIKAENAKAKTSAMGDNDVIEIDGKRWTGLEIKNAIANAKKKAKNSEGEKGEKAGDQEDEVEEEKEEGKKRDKGEAKNDVKEKSVEEDEARRDKVDARNSLGEKKDEDHIEDFKKVAEMRNNQPGVPTISTQVERLKAGAEKYGKMKKEVA